MAEWFDPQTREAREPTNGLPGFDEGSEANKAEAVGFALAFAFAFVLTPIRGKIERWVNLIRRM